MALTSSPSTEQEISIAEQLRRSLGALTPSERRIARTLLSRYPEVGLGSAGELAEASTTSAATVVRLAQKLGFNGFPDFQATLRSELSSRLAGPQDRLDRTGVEQGGVLPTLSGALAATVGSLVETVPDHEFSAAVALLADQSRRIYLHGGRLSHSLADLCANFLARLRPNVSLVSHDPSRRTAQLVEISRRHVLIAFDFRRYEVDTLSLTKVAAERGAKIIVVTDVLLSPVTANADVVLPVRVEVPSPFDSSVAALALVECLALATMQALGDHGVRRMRAWDEIASNGLVTT